MGYSGTYCASTSTVINKITLECFGSVLESIEEVGANPSNGSPHHCETNEENKECVGPRGAVEGQFAACKGKSSCEISPGPAGGGAKCGDPLAHIFVSYTCQMEDHMFWIKLVYGFLISLLNVFVGFLYFLRIEKMIAKSKTEYEEYDAKTLTAGDYSVEIYVEEIYKKFLKEKYSAGKIDLEFAVPADDFRTFFLNYL